MRAQRSRRGGIERANASGDSPTLTATTTVAVTATMILLMAFSIISWLLGNTTLAAVAGTGACTLAADAIRRYLGVAADQGHRPPEVKASDDPGRDD
ncbi:hypothetical protein OHB44_33055 (plasmid) [Micromonospora sp. NBC_00821]|uniref:hypothetical protein n=1 Tax=Micromonospora sp. NBC_00821 TaxID=2975977 RepID=UPI002ED67EEA|nr:hypothetical protein OHB44_33055 [Micromonospora sp. NBC_00821]